MVLIGPGMSGIMMKYLLTLDPERWGIREIENNHTSRALRALGLAYIRGLGYLAPMLNSPFLLSDFEY